MHSQAFIQHRNAALKFFPLTIISVNNQYYITYNNSTDSSIPIGYEIISINEKSPKSINKTLRKNMYQDGNSTPNAETDISNYFQNAYSNFISNPDTFNLIIQGKNQAPKHYSISAQSKSNIDSIHNSRYADKNEMGIPLRFDYNPMYSTATYTIKWFRNEYINQFGQDFNAFTDSIFALIENNCVQNLIIDIRDNTGGWTGNGKKLFSYFIDEPQAYINNIEFNSIDSFSFTPLILSDQGIHDTMQFKTNEHDKYEWTNYPNLRVQPAKSNLFHGNIFILINESSRSCSSVFSSLMRSHTQAIFIGQENGGAQCGQGGMPIVTILPFTGIMIRSSTAKYNLNVNDPSNARGIKVDHEIISDINDHLSDDDPQMKFTFDLIEKQMHFQKNMDDTLNASF